MIRVLRPTDLITLAYFHRRATPNLARSRDPLALSGSDPSTAALLLADLRLPARRHTWIATDQRGAEGLVSVRRGATPQSWEIDRLLLPRQGRADAICRTLLSEAGLGCARHGIQRLYLRLPADHPLVDAVRLAGFVRYTEESVYRREGAGSGSAGADVSPWRRRTTADDQAIFRLYNQVVPQAVRQSEAVTFQEWQSLQRLTPTRRTEQWVLDGAGGLRAWFRVARRGKGGFLEALYQREAEPELVDGLDLALARLTGQATVWVLVPHYQTRLAQLLQERGLEEVERSTVFAKRLAIPVPVPRFAPVPA